MDGLNTSHSSLYALNDALLVDQSSGPTSAAAAASFSSLAVIEHLQSALRHETDRRVEVEKELTAHKKRIRDLEAQLAAREERLTRGAELHAAQLRSIKGKLQQSLRLAATAPGQTQVQPRPTEAGTEDGAPPFGPRRIEYTHHCDECTFRSKSDVSLILHKMNHSIVEQQYVLSATSFTTRNSNSKAIYNCPACDTGANLTRHEVYRHIYDSHTNEKPLSCPYCEYSFTHREYLDEHIRTKHSKAQAHKNMTLRPDVQLNPLIKDAWTSNLLASATAVNTNSASQQSGGAKTGSANAIVTTIITPSIKSLTTKSSIRGRPASGASAAAKGTELKCTFLDCNFATISQDKLDFHMKAHINTKYKCPYCPYVSNTIIDIKRHIQKSKKHEGMKMYSCQKCGFGADCDRMFKEHLRAYHFGYEVHDTVVDYFIEEMFSNKNNKRPGTEDELAQAQLAQLQHQLQHPQLHHPPGPGEGGGGGGGLPPSKKQASANLISNLMETARKQQRGSVGNQTVSQGPPAPQPPPLTTMIEDAGDPHRSAAPTPNPPSHQPVPTSLDSLINSYRTNVTANHQATATNLVANALGLGVNQPVLMYHTLSEHLASSGAATSGGGGQIVENHQQAHVQHHQHQQQQQQQQHFHHSLGPSLGPGGQPGQPQHQHAEALIQQQQQVQQQPSSRPQSQQNPQPAFGGAGGELPGNLQQYVSYANY